MISRCSQEELFGNTSSFAKDFGGRKLEPFAVHRHRPLPAFGAPSGNKTERSVQDQTQR